MIVTHSMEQFSLDQTTESVLCVVTPHCTHMVKGDMNRRFLTLHIYSHVLSVVRIIHCIKMV